ncbi:uncharacterized protein At4g15970 [Brachypodium distachyon]|uniref:Nucleotide-diphospho-sugar transferase domain-containing protein n=1 Tax=Brachypodium distachyon TaxID=15368 RepID=A0A0Q3ETS3_BRADI|nr:uncharacterized protein At4g15970 [Brachypodium distachyon]KQJ90910.1 hypothetical protein BRADI_4g34520v3 [Brachypodium distachyon]|eukprot:XP_003578382.2 uncharacterized protein At4g15970 [Brachypodium distachyon]
MYTLRDFLGFFLGAGITAAFVVLLLPPPPCPCSGVLPAGQELALLDNGSQADPSIKNLSMLQAVNAPKDDLAELLRSAAMEDDTIIMTYTNEAWTLPGSLLDLFLESFRIGVKTQPLLKHLVIVTVDARAFERCQHVHPFCYLLAAAGTGVDFAGEQSFMAGDYLDMMWMRNKFQSRVLELGHGFVFTDVDIVWFRNPLLRIPVGADIAVSCDWFYGDNPYDLNKSTNGGFLYARSSARTRAFFADWYEGRNRIPGAHEQYVFDKEKHELAERHGVTVQFVDTTYLNGQCEPKKDFYKVCTFHANCIVGLKNKLQKLVEVLGEWKQFKAQQELLGSNSTVLTN